MTETPRSGDTGDVVERVVDWWTAPFRDPRFAWALFHLLTSLVLGWMWFGLVVAALSVSLVLVLIGLGVPLTALALDGVEALGRFECRRAGLVGVSIEPHRSERTVGWLRLDAFRDGQRWRRVGYVLVYPFAVTGLVVAVAPAWVLTLTAFGQAVAGLASTSLPQIGLGLVGTLLGAPIAARITVICAVAAGQVTEFFLGADSRRALARRVETLRTDRDQIVAAVATERRRIERDLHDGVQPSLVAAGIDLDLAKSAVHDDPELAQQLLEEAQTTIRSSIGELRILGRGLHPAILEDRGLDAALSAVFARSPIPIDLRVDVPDDLPASIEETAYFVVNEAVANIWKHARARAATVELRVDAHRLLIRIDDDGVGGADLAGGTGLAGMAARVKAVDGAVDVDSPVGGPTRLTVTIPIGGRADAR